MITLRDYQTAAAIVANKRNIILADECGLGKTMTALGAMYLHLFDWPTACHNLVVCPKRLVSQWRDEITRFGTFEPIIIPYGFPFYMFDRGQKPTIYITYYEAVRETSDLQKIAWDFVVIDEAHRMKNRSAKQTIAIKRLHTNRKLLLTGTPIEKSPADLWSLIDYITPGFVGYYQFFDQFVKTVDVGAWKKIVGVKNEVALHRLLSSRMIRRTKDQVAKELPPKIEQVIDVPLCTDQQIAYDQVDNSDDILAEVGPDNIQVYLPNIVAKITRLQQIVSLPSLLGLSSVACAKMDWLKDWVEDNSEPAVIFTRFRDTAIKIATELEADLIIGGQSKAPSFTNKYVVGTIAAMGEGLNLQRATTAIFYDQDWSTIKMSQAVDRIHRLGITSPKLIYYLRSPGTVDNLVLKALERKWSVIELALEFMKEKSLIKL